MQGSYSLSGFRLTILGRTVTHAAVTIMETLGLAPRGTGTARCPFFFLYFFTRFELS